MKRFSSALTVAALLSVVLLPACKKEAVKMNDTTDHRYTTHNNMRAVSVQGFETNSMSWPELVVGTDQSDVAYRKAQLYLSIGLAEVVKDSVIADWITTQTKSATDNVIFFDQLFAAFPGTKQVIENASDPFEMMDSWTYEDVAAMMQYDTFSIKPSIFLANADTADASYKPIATTGYDLDLGDADTHPSDVVMGWHVADDNTITRVNIWEEVARAQVAPILAIDGRVSNNGSFNRTLTDGGGTASSTIPSDYPNMRVSVVKYRINFRYDVSKNSELNVAGACSWKPGGEFARTFLRHSCFDPKKMGDKPLRKIHKNQIGSWWTNQDSYFCRHHSPHPLDFKYGEYDHYYPSGAVLDNRKLLTYNTFEYDWFASLKPLSPANISLSSAPSVWIPIGLKGNMSKYDEWYLFPPSWGSYVTLAASPILILPYPYVGWTHDRSSGKGDLGLKTIDHCTY